MIKIVYNNRVTNNGTVDTEMYFDDLQKANHIIQWLSTKQLPSGDQYFWVEVWLVRDNMFDKLINKLSRQGWTIKWQIVNMNNGCRT